MDQYNEYWQLFITDVMPRWYVTAGQATPKIIASTGTDDENLSQFVQPFGDNWRRSADDQNILMQPVGRFENNSDVARLPVSALRGQISPTPLSVKLRPHDTTLSRGVKLSLNGMSTASRQAVKQHFALLSIKEEAAGYAIT